MPRISALTALTSADSGDTVPILDVSATTTKKITKTAFLSDVADGTLIADDAIQSRHIDWANTGGGDNGGIWWEELGRTTLGSTGDTITVSSLPERKYLEIRVHCIASGAITAVLRFNNDSGTNYASQNITNGVTVSAPTSATSHIIDVDNAAVQKFSTTNVINVAARAKLLTSMIASEATSGAATAPNIRTSAGKWHNTADAITRVDVVNTAAGDFAAGSEVVVLGHN